MFTVDCLIYSRIYTFYSSKLSPLASPKVMNQDSSPDRSPVQKTQEAVSPRVKSLTSDGSPATGNQTWGPARTVELEREQGKSLGISIVGRYFVGVSIEGRYSVGVSIVGRYSVGVSIVGRYSVGISIVGRYSVGVSIVGRYSVGVSIVGRYSVGISIVGRYSVGVSICGS